MFKNKLTEIFMFLFVVTTGFFIPLSTSSLAQEEFPNRPIEIIVSYAAGGSTDLLFRELADLGNKYLRQPIIVVNKPGGGGTLGAGYVYNAKPDGYTLGECQWQQLP